MNRLKIGDKVIRINEDYANMKVKDVGTVSKIRFGDDGNPRDIMLEEFDGLHMVNNLAKLEKEEKFKVGDEVIRIKGGNAGMTVGDVATIRAVEYGRAKILRLVEYSGSHMMENFKKAERTAKFKVDECVRIIKDMTLDDRIAKVVEIDTCIPVQNAYKLKLKDDREIWLLENELVKLNNKKKEKRKKNSSDELHELKREKFKIERRIDEIERNIEVGISDLVILKIMDNAETNLDLNMVRKGREIICTLSCKDTGKLLGKGSAKAMVQDTFDELVGCKLAYHRCMINFNKREMYKIIKETF